MDIESVQFSLHPKPISISYLEHWRLSPVSDCRFHILHSSQLKKLHKKKIHHSFKFNWCIESAMGPTQSVEAEVVDCSEKCGTWQNFCLNTMFCHLSRQWVSGHSFLTCMLYFCLLLYQYYTERVCLSYMFCNVIKSYWVLLETAMQTFCFI